MDTTLLTDVASTVATPAPRTERAAAAAALIHRATGARWVGIYTVTDTTVTNEAWSGPEAPAHPSFATTDGLTGHAVRTRSATVSNDVASDPRYLTNQADTGSELIVPILDGHRVVGTLDIESAEVGAFDGADVARFEHLAQALRPLWSR